MSEISGFDWWFRNREYVLRENLESVEATSMAAAARSARLSSQLSRLQGSLEHRLNALSAAFDAYVQLGDIREQLDAYGDTAVIRREAIAAVGMLGDGKQAPPVDDRGSGYWVAAATNAVIARASGAPDITVETAIAGQEPDAAMFLVAAPGALGHGAEVAGAVAQLLHTDDGRLNDHQLDLWQAVMRGDFGPDVIKIVLTDWNDRLSARPADEWWNWATEQGSRAGRDTLDWIEDQVGHLANDQTDDQANDQGATGQPAMEQLTHDHDDSGPIAPADDQQPERTLRDLVLELINSGFGEEKQLLATARVLRNRIEHPESATTGLDQDHSETGGTALVADVVRAGYVRLQPSPTRSRILMVLAPLLVGSAEPQAAGLLTEQPAVATARIGGRSVDVTPQGPDPKVLAEAVAWSDQWPDPAAGKGRLYAFGAATVASAVVALVLAISGVAIWLVVVLLIVAVVMGILAIRNLQAARRQNERRGAEAAERDKSIKDAMERAAAIQTAQRQLVRKTADQLDRIRAAVPSSAESILESISGQQNAASVN